MHGRGDGRGRRASESQPIVARIAALRTGPAPPSRTTAGGMIIEQRPEGPRTTADHERPLTVDAVASLSALDLLRDEWHALYARDAQASVFMSWEWLRAWAEVSPYPWSVLAARDDSGAARALFPISPRDLGSPALRVDQAREIHPMGDPLADYRGMIVDPGAEARAIAAFARHLAGDGTWDRLALRDIRDDRLPHLLEELAHAEADLEIDVHEGNVCPLLELPETWEQYLKDSLTPASRKSIKKALRHADQRGCRLTTLRNEAMDTSFAALTQLARMASKLAPDDLDRALHLLRACAEVGSAEISVLWIDDAPAAAQGSFVDERSRTLAHYLAAYDERFAAVSPGRTLDALAIRDAIERGCQAVDFLRGDEPYKHQFGARPRTTTHAIVTRRRVSSAVRLRLAALRDRLGV